VFLIVFPRKANDHVLALFSFCGFSLVPFLFYSLLCKLDAHAVQIWMHKRREWLCVRVCVRACVCVCARARVCVKELLGTRVV
jgi:hypothetical protein